MDGTTNKSGAVTHIANLTLRCKGTHTQPFHVADLGEDHIILGMPFFSAANPKINWTEKTFQGKIEAATTNAHRKPFPPQSQEPHLLQEALNQL